MVFFRIKVSICKSGDCGLQTYQTVKILKRATTLEINTISAILFIHCYRQFLIYHPKAIILFLSLNCKSKHGVKSTTFPSFDSKTIS